MSAIRYYEARGLVRATRGAGNQRRFLRSDIRRLSFALIAQQLGLTLSEIEAELSTLPRGQAPTLADWRGIGTRMRGALAAKIAMLQKTHELLDGCIGCGCLSLDRCALFNPNDRAARAGPGPRFLLGDKASDFGNDRLSGIWQRRLTRSSRVGVWISPQDGRLTPQQIAPGVLAAKAAAHVTVRLR